MPMNPRLLRPTPTGFNPRRLAGLAVWLDASKQSSISFHGATTSIATWADLSGNSRDASQTISGNAPVYTTGGFNGRNCVTFSGANASEQLNLGNLSSVFSSYGEIFVAFEANKTSYAVYRTRNNSPIHRENASQGRFGCFIQTRRVVTVNFPASGKAVLNERASGDSHTIERDGGAQSNTAAGNTYNGGDVHTIGAGVTGDLTFAFGGSIGEVLLFNADIGATARAAVYAYLKAKWGTP